MKRYLPATYPVGDTRVTCIEERSQGSMAVHQRPGYSFQDARDTSDYLNERATRHAQPLLAPGALAK